MLRRRFDSGNITMQCTRGVIFLVLTLGGALAKTKTSSEVVGGCAWGALFGWKDLPEGEVYDLEAREPIEDRTMLAPVLGAMRNDGGSTVSETTDGPLGSLDLTCSYWTLVHALPEESKTMEFRASRVPECRIWDITTYDAYGRTLETLTADDIVYNDDGGYSIILTNDPERAQEARDNGENVLSPAADEYRGRLVGGLVMRIYVPYFNNRGGGEIEPPEEDTLPQVYMDEEGAPEPAPTCEELDTWKAVGNLQMLSLVQGLTNFTGLELLQFVTDEQRNVVLPIEDFGITRGDFIVTGPADSYLNTMFNFDACEIQDEPLVGVTWAKKYIEEDQAKMWTVTSFELDNVNGALLPTLFTAAAFRDEEEQEKFYANPSTMAAAIKRFPDPERPDYAFILVNGAQQDEPSELHGATWIPTSPKGPAFMWRIGFENPDWPENVRAFVERPPGEKDIELDEWMGDYYPLTKICTKADYEQNGVDCESCIGEPTLPSDLEPNYNLVDQDGVPLAQTAEGQKKLKELVKMLEEQEAEEVGESVDDEESDDTETENGENIASGWEGDADDVSQRARELNPGGNADVTTESTEENDEPENGDLEPEIENVEAEIEDVEAENGDIEPENEN